MYLVPPLVTLKSSYPAGPIEDLAREMGFEPKEVLEPKGSELWAHTCAVCMSTTLLRCGIPLGKEPKRGSETLIRAGKLKGKHYWMSQHNLSNHLLKTIFGKPTYQGGDVDALLRELGEGGGIISFYSMSGYPGGHIDVTCMEEGRRHLMHYSGDSSVTFADYASRTADIRFWRAS